MASVAEVAAARYIGKYLHRQSYHVRKYIMNAGWVFKGSSLRYNRDEAVIVRMMLIPHSHLECGD